MIDGIPFDRDPFRLPASDLPKLRLVTNHIAAPTVSDVYGSTAAELKRVNLAPSIKPGQRIALTAGSRGVADIATILRATADYVRAAGGEPVVLPTMGSHGGATAQGQVEMLRFLGVTEESVGCPILATMETVQLGTTAAGLPVYLDKNAAECDGIIVVARVKQHTDFDADIESGLHKMMVIGLGKHVGAIAAHRGSFRQPFAQLVLEVGAVVLHNTVAPVIGGVVTVENAFDQTAIIEAVKPADFVEREKALLAQAKQLIGKIPFTQLDVLVVNESGKNVSGNGMDTNVTARVMSIWGSGPSSPKIRRIILRGLTEATHGNATGIGQADFVLRRMLAQIDWLPTYMNLLTGLGPEYARIPMVAQHDLQALCWAVHTAGANPANTARLMWIQNTMDLGHFYISEAMVDEALRDPNLEVAPSAIAIPFDESGHADPLAAH
jgi:hypothetical protein